MQSEDPSLNLICSYRHHIWAERLSRKSEEGSVGSVQVNRWKKKKVTKSCPCGNPVNICGSSRAQHIPAEEPLCSNDWTSVPRLHTPTKWTADGSLLSKHKCIVGQNWHWHPLGSSTSREGTKTFKTDANQAFAQRSGFTLKKRRQ